MIRDLEHPEGSEMRKTDLPPLTLEELPVLEPQLSNEDRERLLESLRQRDAYKKARSSEPV